MANPLDLTSGQLDSPYSNKSDMSYSDNTRFQMVSQFQQRMNEYPRGSSKYVDIISMPRFQYGTNQDIRFYQRQRDFGRQMFGMEGARAAFDVGTMAMSGLIPASTFGWAASMAGPAIAAAVPLYFINKGIDMTIQRQRTMQSLAADIEQYRDRIGMPTLTYNQANMLSTNLTNQMYSKGQFFDPQQQQSIFKFALSNDMITGKNRGMTTGDIKTFEKNFSELLSTVKQVTVTMKTTATGAQALIKEMQSQGFGTMGQIGTAITAASGYGSFTGIGTQNMLQIGAAGIGIAQRMGFQPSTGANIAMANAAQAGWMSSGVNLQWQRSVEAMGGVAQAGAALAQTQMGFMQTNLSRRVMASVMDQKQGLDSSALANLLNQTQSGHEIINRAAINAHGWGINRVMFGRRFAENINAINQNPQAAAMYQMAIFNAWRSNRRGNLEQQAQVFAQQMLGIPGQAGQLGFAEQNAVNLQADWLMSDKGLAQASAAQDVARMVQNAPGPGQSILSRLGNDILFRSPMGRAFTGMGVSAATAGGNFAEFVGRGLRSSALSTRRWLNELDNTVFGNIAPYGLYNYGNLISTERAYNNLLGLTPANITRGDIRQVGALSQARRTELGELRAADVMRGQPAGYIPGWGPKVMEYATAKDYNVVLNTIRQAIGGSLDPAEALKNADFLKAAGITRGSQAYEYLRKGGTTAFYRMGLNLSASMNDKMEKARQSISAADSFLAQNPARASELKDIATEFNIRTIAEQNELIDRVKLKKGPLTFRDTAILKMGASVQGQRTIDQQRGVDTYMPETIQRVAESTARINAGMNALLGVYTRASVDASGEEILPLKRYMHNTSIKQALKRFTGVDVDKSPTGFATAMGQLTKMVETGQFTIGNYQQLFKDNPDLYRQLTRRQEDLFKTFGLQGVTTTDKLRDFMDRFGKQTKQYSDAADFITKNQAIIGRRNAVIKMLKGAEGGAEAINFLMAGGLEKGTEMTENVAAALGRVSGGLKAADVQAMQTAGTFAQRMLGAVAVSPAGSGSRLAAINSMVERLNQAGVNRKDWTSLVDPVTGEKQVFKTQREAIDYLIKLRDTEQSLQKSKELSSAEAASGRSLSGVVTSPILNYWNNKWSL